MTAGASGLMARVALAAFGCCVGAAVVALVVGRPRMRDRTRGELFAAVTVALAFPGVVVLLVGERLVGVIAAEDSVFLVALYATGWLVVFGIAFEVTKFSDSYLRKGFTVAVMVGGGIAIPLIGMLLLDPAVGDLIPLGSLLVVLGAGSWYGPLQAGKTIDELQVRGGIYVGSYALLLLALVGVILAFGDPGSETPVVAGMVIVALPVALGALVVGWVQHGVGRIAAGRFSADVTSGEVRDPFRVPAAGFGASLVVLTAVYATLGLLSGPELAAVVEAGPLAVTPYRGGALVGATLYAGYGAHRYRLQKRRAATRARIEEAEARRQQLVEGYEEWFEAMTPPSMEALGEAENAVEEDDYGSARDAARRAIDRAEREVEVAQVFESAADAIDDAFPGGDIDAAERRLEDARDALGAGEYDRAGEVAAEAMDLAQPDVESALDRAADRVETAMDRREAGDYDAAIDAWEAAGDWYDNAATIADREDQGELRARAESAAATVVENREATAVERDHESVRRRVERAIESVEAADEAFDAGDYETASERYERAERIYTEALELASERGFGVAADIEQALGEFDDNQAACDLAAIQERAERVVADVEAQPGEAERRLADLRAEVDGYEHGDVDDLMTWLSRWHVRAGIERVQDAIEDATDAYDGTDYERARDEFESAVDDLEELFGRATEYGLPEERAGIDRLIDACSTNANAARRALYADDHPSLVEPDDLGDRATAGPGARGGEGRSPPTRTDVDEELRRELPDHEVLEWIGSGGNADVSKVRLEDGTVRALKVPRWQGTLAPETFERFVREAETWAEIDDHENIVSVVDWGSTPYPWLLLEYVPGSLADRTGAMPVEEVTPVLVAVADALKHAHYQGVVHLDLKPENVLIGGDRVPKLADWGLARVLIDHTQTEVGLTPAYSAPEQLTSDVGELDRRTDIYQLGVLAYELLTGRLPFEADRPVDLQQAILNEQPDPPSTHRPGVSRAVDDAVLQALAKDPADRFESVILFRDALTDS